MPSRVSVINGAPPILFFASVCLLIFQQETHNER
jgi:hypothetical protein